MSELNESDTFGVNVWWHVPQDIKIAGEVVKNVLIDNGFEEKDMPMPSTRAEVSRAAYSFQNRRGKSDRRVTEKAKSTENYVVYGILDQRVVSDEEVAFGQNTTIRYDKESNSVLAQGDLADEFHIAYQEYKDTIIDDDIRHFLTRVIGMCRGIPKRPSGGIYFIPSAYMGIIESAQAVLKELNTSAEIYIERVVNGEQERINIARSVDGNIEKEIESILGMASRVEKRASSVKSHQAKMSELEELIGLYSEVLGKEAKFESLMEKIQEAGQILSDKVVALQKQAGGSSTSGRGNSEKMLKAAKKILEDEGFPMHYAEITKRALSQGLIKSKGATPERTMCGCLSTALKDGDARFKRVKKGTYGLTSIPQNS